MGNFYTIGIAYYFELNWQRVRENKNNVLQIWWLFFPRSDENAEVEREKKPVIALQLYAMYFLFNTALTITSNIALWVNTQSSHTLLYMYMYTV